MNFILKLGLVLISLYEILCQTCKVQNEQYNLLTIVSGETFRLPLNEYFVGDGLTYSIKPKGVPFAQNDQIIPQGTILGNVISTTSSNFNNNLYLQGLYSYALTKANDLDYTIYQSQLSSYNNSFATITSGTCYQINFIFDMVVVTCSQQGTNILEYIFYQQNDPQNNFTILVDTFTITPGSYVTTEAAGQYIVTYTNVGTFNNGTYKFISTNISAIEIIQNANERYDYNNLVLPAVLDSQQSDFYTGISVNSNGILFISTYYNGFTAINLLELNGKFTYFNYFNVGTLGISSYKLDFSNNMFYIAFWSTEGLIVGEFQEQVLNSKPGIYTFEMKFFPSQLIEISQISIENMFSTQVFINTRYIVVSNSNGISIYPSIFNAINDWKLLYYYSLNAQSIVFDYSNNIIVAVSGQNVYTYSLQNPILLASNLPSNTTIQNFTITPQTNMYGKIKNICQSSLTLFYKVISNDQYQQTFIGYQINNTKDTFIQWGPFFELYMGSTKIVNINKMLIGPAILAGYPTTQQADSNFDISFSNVLSTPSIQSPFQIKSKLIGNQTILYSQVFYDATYLKNYQDTEPYSDNYLQLVQVIDYVALFQCQALSNAQCSLIASISIQNALVEQFALSMSTNDSINVAYIWNDLDVKNQTISGKTTICMLNYPYSNFYQTCKTLDLDSTNNTKAKQIALVQDSFYMLYSQIQEEQQQQNYFSAFNVLEFLTQNSKITDLQSFETYQNTNSLKISSFSFNIPAYGNIIFLNTEYSQFTDMAAYYYFVTAINYNGNQLNSSSQYSYQLEEIGTLQTYFSITKANVSLQLTIEGMYLLISNDGQNTLTFYPAIDFLPLLIYSKYESYDVRPPVKGINLQLYGVQNIVQVAASARFLYVMVQPSNQTLYQIYVYKNTPSIQNALYYVISSEANDQIVNAPFSVTSAIQYDGIIFRSKGNDGYRSSYLLPEFVFKVQCNLNSNFQAQIEYSYVIFKATSLLQNNKVPESAEEYQVTFQAVNLISFVKEASTNVNSTNLLPQGYVQVDPRQYFLGNIQSFQQSNGTSSASFYYFDILSPVVKQPQTTNYMFPITAVSAYMQISKVNSVLPEINQQNQYWFTFVQTNRLVYVTPYVYYNPPQDFVDNSTIKIDYPLIYKLPVLDISPNSQKCPLIFVDAYSKGVVSVCGTNINNKFTASFTLFNTLTQQIQETKLIQLDEAFPSLGEQNYTNDGSYSLQSATYLDIGVIVLQFQYNYNFGQSPPTIIILSFLYTSNLNRKIATYPSNPNLFFYQYIQPIQLIYQVVNNTQPNQFSLTVFSVTTQYFGGLNNISASNPVSSIMFGLLCVSEIQEQCIQPIPSSENPLTIYPGNVITVNPEPSLSSIFSTNASVSYNQTYSLLPAQSRFFIFLLQELISVFTENSIQQVIQAGSPIIQQNIISEVPLIAVSQGTAYLFKLQIELDNGQYLQSQYACTLLGLSDKNRILQVSASSSQTSQYQVVAIVANPTKSNSQQVSLLNYGFINKQCNLQSTAVTSDPIIVQNDKEILVTAIGSITYTSTEAIPILSLMQPPQIDGQPIAQIARTLISDNQVITLLDTSPYLTISAYPNYNLKGGVTLNSKGQFSNITEPLITSISAMSIQTFINNQQISGDGGSTIFNLTISNYPINSSFPDSVWDRNLWDQFIWGFIMFAIIVGVVGYLFYKSQPLPYDRF